MTRQIKETTVVIVDDCIDTCRILHRALQSDPSIQVVGVAHNAFEGRSLLISKKPKVLLLDVHMPHINGIQFLRSIMRHYPTPTLIITGHTKSDSDDCQIALEAYAAGAIGFFEKNKKGRSFSELSKSLRLSIKEAGQLKLGRYRQVGDTSRLNNLRDKHDLVKSLFKPCNENNNLEQAESRPESLIAIGASAGGVQALETVLSALDMNAPPVVIAQHVPPGLSSILAESLNRSVTTTVVEAQKGMFLKKGYIYLAPSEHHLRIIEDDHQRYLLTTEDAMPKSGPCPSVDILFESAANLTSINTIGVLLTGMGADGAEGLLKLRQKGSTTIVQDQKSCFVFGMPKAAIEIGAASQVLPLSRIGSSMILAASRNQRSGSFNIPEAS